MELDEARELLRALRVEGADSQRLEELECLIDELDGRARAYKEPRQDRAHVKLMRRDLDVDKASYRRLVSVAQDLWGAAMDDHYTRHKITTERPLTGEFDPSYGMTPTEIEATYFGRSNRGLWATDIYRRGPGGKPNDPPLGPLYEVYLLVRAWWPRPTFGLMYKEKRREDFTAAERFFLDIAQAMDPRYTTTDCASVYEKWRKRRQ